MFDRYSPVPAFRRIVLRAAAPAGFAALLAILLPAPAQAQAQTACLPRGKLVELLGGKYSEQQVAVGLENGGRLFEVFASADGGTWTMVVTTPDGASCVVAAGLEWQAPDKLKDLGPET